MLSWKVFKVGNESIQYWLEYVEDDDLWFTDAELATIKAVHTWNAEAEIRINYAEKAAISNFAKEFIELYGKVSKGILLAFITQSL